jgi:DNA repair photolyase
MAMSDQAQRSPVMREVLAKSILNRSALGDYSLNCYVGCTHACAYCYARYMQRFHPHEEPWGGFVDVKINAVETLERQLRRLPPGEVFVSSACDGWQPLERERKLTRECCRRLLDHGFRVNALTKSALILRDLDIFAGHDARVAVTLTTLDPGLQRCWEPGASRVEERLRVLAEARAAGLETGIMFGPILPFLYDSPDALEGLFERAAECDVDVIWVDGLNPRPKVWEAVQALLRQRFPDLEDRYRRVLFSPVVRTAYLDGLRERVNRAARRFRMLGRVRGCV